MTAERRVRALLPGVLILVVGAVAAVVLATASPMLEPLVVAIALGVLLANTAGVPAWAEPGLRLRVVFLETAIVLLGARVAVSELAALGPVIALLVCATVVAGVVVVEAVGRLVLGLSGALPSLLAAGSSICGVSAVASVGQVIEARDDQIAIAAATITAFDAVALVALPVLGHSLGLTGTQFGVWAGLSMFSTGPVTAAGFAHSPAAGQWAVVTKLARNALLGFVAVGYSAAYARSRGRGDSRGVAGLGSALRRLVDGFPAFLVGFFLLAVVANAGLLSPAVIASIGGVTDWLFLLAFVGLGTAVDVETVRGAGIAAGIAVLAYFGGIALLSLVAVVAIF